MICCGASAFWDWCSVMTLSMLSGAFGTFSKGARATSDGQFIILFWSLSFSSVRITKLKILFTSSFSLMQFRLFLKRGLIFASPFLVWALVVVVVDPFDYFDLLQLVSEQVKLENAKPL